MTAIEQAKKMVEIHGSKESAIDNHNTLMYNIENIYPSKETCIENSLSYSHLQNVKTELEKL